MMMEYINHSDEYRQLEERYAEMSDTQIESMAAKIEDFTEMAQQVLRAEVSKRGLGPQDPDMPEDSVEAARRALLAEKAKRDLQDADSSEGAGDPSETKKWAEELYVRGNENLRKGFDPAAYDFVTVENAVDEAHARQVMSLLESAGVKAYMGPLNVESVDDYKGDYDSGVEIKVMRYQLNFVQSGLLRFGPPDPEAEATLEKDYAPRCPKCNSQDVVFQGIDVEPGENPGPDTIYNWSCDACGHPWKDDGIERDA